MELTTKPFYLLTLWKVFVFLKCMFFSFHPLVLYFLNPIIWFQFFQLYLYFSESFCFVRVGYRDVSIQCWAWLLDQNFPESLNHYQIWQIFWSCPLTCFFFFFCELDWSLFLPEAHLLLQENCSKQDVLTATPFLWNEKVESVHP